MTCKFRIFVYVNWDNYEIMLAALHKVVDGVVHSPDFCCM